MRKRITSSGRSARDATVRDLQESIAQMRAAIECLNNVKGLGAELYIERLNKLIDKFTNVKNRIARIS